MTAIRDEYLTVAEVVAMLRIREQTVRQYIREGKIPARKFGNERGIRVPLSGLNSFMFQPDESLVRVDTNCINPRSARGRIGMLADATKRGNRK